MKRKILFIKIAIILLTLTADAQSLKTERVLSLNMLEKVKIDIQKNYYDSNFRGVDIEKNYQKTRELINNSSTVSQMIDAVTRFCYLFDDSHLYFQPPKKPFKVDYGFDLLLINDKVFITEIKADSDAYKKGLRIGDWVYMIEDFILKRDGFYVVQRNYFDLQPQPSLHLLIVKPDGKKYKVEVQAKVEDELPFEKPRREYELEYQKFERENYIPHFYEKIPGLAIIKMPSFNITPTKATKMIGKVKDSDALILDLRGNHGGYLESVAELLGNFFDKKVDGGKIIEREGTKKWTIKPSVKKPFTGKLVVLIDSASTSGAEIFARVIQLEKRGTIIGDQSRGAVMASVFYPHTFGEMRSYVYYGVSVTVADLTMKDGGRLEKTGVVPDEKIVPTISNLIKNQDPIMSRAAQILGYKLSFEEAGLIFDSDKN